jgi:hypothetical protein
MSDSYLTDERPVNLVINGWGFYRLTAMNGLPYFTGNYSPIRSTESPAHLGQGELRRDELMAHKTNLRRRIFNVTAGLTPLLVVACGPSIATQSEQDKPKQLSAEAEKKPSGDAGVALLLGAQKVAPPPAKPSGAPPPARTTPPSYYEPVGPFFFYVETLTSAGPSRYGLIPTVPCVQSGVFKRGMRLVFRFEILDTSTGKRVTDKDGATVKVRLPHGEEVSARWAIRGSVAALPDSAWMWDASWDIPPDYPVGSLDYNLLVSVKDGRTGTFIPPIQKTPTSDTRVRIID